LPASLRSRFRRMVRSKLSNSKLARGTKQLKLPRLTAMSPGRRPKNANRPRAIKTSPPTAVSAPRATRVLPQSPRFIVQTTLLGLAPESSAPQALPLCGTCDRMRDDSPAWLQLRQASPRTLPGKQRVFPRNSSARARIGYVVELCEVVILCGLPPRHRPSCLRATQELTIRARRGFRRIRSSWRTAKSR